ncbi:hypothetical protein [Cohnella mopanensis]|uniref:hypothetical protein n=1 Tax=Cohnella mopanensis TaxID=2911966 RepID=UPI001EF99999|nr:hypothetical protein [Cohnella mopanensis]
MSVKTGLRAALPVLCAVALMSGCATSQSGTTQKSMQLKTAPRTVQDGNLHKSSVIPSYNGPKYNTTNRKGTTYSGMGTSIHSRLGSSGLNAGGYSDRLEAMLYNEGIQGVRILKIGNKIVIGKRKDRATGIHPLQSKLLSPNAGSSGTSNKHTSGSTAVRSHRQKDDTLEKAKHRIQQMVGSKVRVLTVTHPDALAAMERAKAKSEKNASAKAHSRDIALILKHAKGTK